MASVFLSYDRDDEPRVRPIASALEQAGHSVWWDRHIKAGAQYSKEIDKALKAADAVVVLWSEQSVESAWVRDEAAAGRDSGRLIPAKLDLVEPPLGFRQYQTIDLSRRKRRGNPAHLKTLIDAVESVTAIEPQTSTAAVKPTPVRRHRYVASPVLLMPLIIIIGVGLFVWRPWVNRAETGVVAIVAAADDPGSNTFARDLLVKLGNLQTEQSGSMRLVRGDDPAAAKADYLLQAAIAAGGTNSASLMLMSAKDRKVLWSKDFQQPSGRYGDLTQQVAFTAGRLLGCAAEGTHSPGESLTGEALKPYLNACAQYSEAYSIEDVGAVMPQFREVVDAAPRFEAGWGKLLLAQSDLATVSAASGVRDPQATAELRRNIEHARSIDPDLPEAAVAESALLPLREFAGRIRLLDEAVRHSPDNPAVLSSRARLLLEVGRLADALEDNERAALLDPFSPAIRINHIFALAYVGRMDSARRKLDEVERLWPGTRALSDAQFYFHLRYGDPRRALTMEQTDTARGGPRQYLEAKINPTQANVDGMFLLIDRNLARMPNKVDGLGWAMPVFGEFNRNEELFKKLLNWPDAGDLTKLSANFFWPQLRAFRRDPRFLVIAKRAGLVSYWRESGKWPDFCFDAEQTYDCKAEAAKLT